MQMRISLNPELRQQVIAKSQSALHKGDRRLCKRSMAILDVVDGLPIETIAERLVLSERSIHDYLVSFLHKGLASLVYQRPPGRPARLTSTQRKTLGELIDGGPEAAGYDCGCWTTALLQDLIEHRFGVSYDVFYMAELLKNLGFSYQKARFASDHLGEVAAKQQVWMEQTWPTLLQTAQNKKAMLLFGDEASFAQWGSLSYTWARRGVQPTVKTSGQRKAYKVFGLIDYFTGAFFYQTLAKGRFTGESYAAFLTTVLAKTTQHLILIQDGARYHTSKAMSDFFAQHTDRLTVQQLPAYSPDFNPIEYLWRNLKKQATHLRYFPTFDKLTAKVDEKLAYFAHLPKTIKALMGKYCSSLGSHPDSEPGKSFS
jgi:transposase